MINYSVYKQPNPADETAEPKAYAKAQMTELIPFDALVTHLADHNGVFSRGTVKGVIADACSCIVELLLDGKKVQFGELGDFWISLSSNGTDTIESFTSKNIKAVNIIFTPGDDFENLVGRAKFNLVSSRVAQAATLKAEKTGGTVVDLEAARLAAKQNGSSSTNGNGSNTNGSNGTNSGNSGGTNTGGGSGSSTGSETPTVNAPVISGTTPFTESTQATITGPTGAAIYYTVDGSTPTSSSSLYSSALTLTATTTVKAIAVKDGVSSAVTTKVFTKGTGGGETETE